MIDVHCHLEQKDYEGKREKIILECKKRLKAIITCAAHPNDFNFTVSLMNDHVGFVFCSFGIHPLYIKDFGENEIGSAISKIENLRKNNDKIVAIGEVGLDYYWVKEREWQEKQKILFREMIVLSKKLDLPLLIHSRDAMADTISILEEEGMKNKKVLMHLFTERKFLQRIIENNWFISIGPSIGKSKDIKKITRDMPLNKIMLETDSPWFKQEGQDFGTPLNTLFVCRKIAEVKNLTEEEIEKQTDLNAINFFKLKLK